MEELFDNPSVLHSKDTLSQVWLWLLCLCTCSRCLRCFWQCVSVWLLQYKFSHPSMYFSLFPMESLYPIPLSRCFFSLWPDLPLRQVWSLGQAWWKAFKGDFSQTGGNRWTLPSSTRSKCWQAQQKRWQGRLGLGCHQHPERARPWSTWLCGIQVSHSICQGPRYEIGGAVCMIMGLMIQHIKGDCVTHIYWLIHICTWQNSFQNTLCQPSFSPKLWRIERGSFDDGLPSSSCDKDTFPIMSDHW